MIGNDKERINFTISKEDKEKILKIAKSENRTLSNAINTAIKEYIKKHSDKSDS